MNFDRVIIFDIYGEYGHFRKFNTTTSPLTYCIPTPSALYGILGAVLGIERENSRNQVKKGQYHLRELFSEENVALAIRPLTEVKKERIGFNLLDTGSYSTFFNITNRTQIEYEVLKNPHFRIYLVWNHSSRVELMQRLKEKRFHFNPYLGISQMTANVDWVDERVVEKISGVEYVPYSTAINLSEIHGEKPPVEIEKIVNEVFQVETFPIEMTKDRTISRYGEIMVELYGNKVWALPNEKSFVVKGEGNIQFL